MDNQDKWSIIRCVALIDDTEEKVLRIGAEMTDAIDDKHKRYVLEENVDYADITEKIAIHSERLGIQSFNNDCEEFLGYEDEWSDVLKNQKAKDIIKAMSNVESSLINLYLEWEEYNLDELHDNSKYPFQKDLLEQIHDVQGWIESIKSQMSN
jgi:hypothetical protein